MVLYFIIGFVSKHILSTKTYIVRKKNYSTYKNIYYVQQKLIVRTTPYSTVLNQFLLL